MDMPLAEAWIPGLNNAPNDFAVIKIWRLEGESCWKIDSALLEFAKKITYKAPKVLANAAVEDLDLIKWKAWMSNTKMFERLT